VKKTWSLILIACLILALGLAAGCGGDQGQPQDAGNPDKTITTKLVVGVIGEPHTEMLKMVNLNWQKRELTWYLKTLLTTPSSIRL